MYSLTTSLKLKTHKRGSEHKQLSVIGAISLPSNKSKLNQHVYFQNTFRINLKVYKNKTIKKFHPNILLFISDYTLGLFIRCSQGLNPKQ